MEGAYKQLRHLIITRFIHLKKQWFSFFLWLVLPFIATIIIIQITSYIQQDTKVPIGLVLEEETNQAMNLYQSIEESPLLRVEKLNKTDALRNLKKHEIDSVFIIRDGYENAIKSGQRNQLIQGYHSNLSFAYNPVKEMIASLVQQETGRSKAAYFIMDLSKEHSSNLSWTWDEIVETSKMVQQEENLLHSTFTYASNSIERETSTFNVWGIWALLSILSTMLLFDWIIKERSKNIKIRFPFMKISFQNYLLGNLLIYTVILFLMDGISLIIIYQLFNGINLPSIGTLFSFRMMLILGAFLLALCFKNIFNYYSFSFAFTLFLAISSGALFPVKGITNRFTWLEFVNPLNSFLSGNATILWSFILIIISGIWYGREVFRNA